MAADLTFPVREAIVGFLRAQGSLTALVASGSIFGQMQPPNSPYPFVRCGSPNASPLDYACQNGSIVAIDLHVFSDDEEQCGSIASKLVAVLDEKRIDLDPTGELDATWRATQTMRDPVEPDVFHAAISFDFEASL